MIFTRIAIAALVATGLVAVLGPGGPDPGVSIEAQRLVDERGRAADAALGELEVALGDALDAVREGTARTASGDLPPGPSLAAAADRIDAALDVAEVADDAVRALGAASVTAGLDTPPIDVSVSRNDLAAISAELRALTASADGFADLRLRAEGLSGLIAVALDATEAGDADAAAVALDAARADLERLEAWESGLSSFPVWLEASGELLAATEDLVEAVRADDRSGAIVAAERVAALEEEAVVADRALRIAMAEGSAFVTAGPAARLAEAERRTTDVRDQVASILQSAAR